MVATDDHHQSSLYKSSSPDKTHHIYNYQGLDASSSCNGCDCPMTIRLNPAKASNTTVITSPRKCDEDSYMMINHYDGL